MEFGVCNWHEDSSVVEKFSGKFSLLKHNRKLQLRASRMDLEYFSAILFWHLIQKECTRGNSQSQHFSHEGCGNDKSRIRREIDLTKTLRCPNHKFFW